MEDLVSILIKSGTANPDNIKPCSMEEVAKLEAHLKLKLPSAYRDFLLAMGHGAGDYFVGTTTFYNAAFRLREAALELLHEVNSNFELPNDAVVFSMHQGYVFDYFCISDGDDPCVYTYMEYDEKPTLASSNLSSYLLAEAKSHARFRGTTL